MAINYTEFHRQKEPILIGRYPIPNSWTWRSLGEHAQVSGGFGFPKEQQGKLGLPYPFIKVSDMNTIDGEMRITSAANTIDDKIAGLLKLQIFPENTIIFPKIGGAIATNKKRLLGYRATFDNNVMGVVTDQLLDHKWLLYYLLSIDLMDLAHIGPVPSIRQSAVQGMPIPLPYPDDPTRSLAEQRRIVARIEALFAELRECRHLHGEIVKDTGRLMDAVLAEVFENLAHEHNLAETNQVCISITDGNHITPQYVDSGIPFLFVSNIVHRYIDFEGTKFVTPEYYETISPSRKPEMGDILYSVVGSYGVPVEVDTERPFCFQRHIGIFKPDRKKINPSFLRWILDCPQVLDQAHKVVTGSAQKTLTLTHLRKLKFPYPKDVNTQKAVANHIQAFNDEVREMKKTQDEDTGFLKDMEQAILAQAFRGEL
ncbi:MAG: restriction endonuclease subunit S [Caldilineaceae bacterium]